MTTAPQTDFERFALDHTRHTHCLGCGACIVDPSIAVQGFPVWCIGCRDRIKANCQRVGVPVPWRGAWEFV